ncbi:hypothetical protein RFI_00335, partial [Reticulomyxa filosa]
SVAETLRILFEYDKLAQASEIKKELEVSDKLWWHLLCDTYAKADKWSALEEYIEKNTSKRNPPPIGYLFIIELCVQHRQTDRAKYYISKLHDLHEKLEWFCQLKLWNEAVDAAYAEKAVDALQTIQRTCKDQAVLRKIEQLLEKL